MNKKKIIAIALSVLMILPSAVFAKGNGNSDANSNSTKVEQSKDKNKPSKPSKPSNPAKPAPASQSGNGQAQKQAAQQNKNDKKQQIQNFKAQIKTKHEQMKSLRQQTIAVRSQIEQKKEQLTAILNELKAGTKTLPEDQLNALLALAQNIQDDSSKIKATAEIKTEVSDVQTKLNKQDFNNALNALDAVIVKLQGRLDALNKLNSDLDAALAIANTATAPAPASSDSTGN